ncbi:hypothetical protein [Nitrospina watsonii]|uniref:Uncharacterized protein n=1 Tax=Nitrospina watsonii TaxID=1323948 RepID=A0ABN8VW19_9BACT|nr:hypothetical protein [Nitrospina watsonii]CAI2717014.1 protein of unknown function [Nitrospina watsonii]
MVLSLVPAVAAHPDLDCRILALTLAGNRLESLGLSFKRCAISLLACLIFISNNIYISYQSHWAKNQAAIHQLKKQKPLKDVGMYFMTNHLPMGMGVDYHYAEVSLTLNAAWGGERYMGVPPCLQKHRYDREWVGIVLNELKQGKNPLPASEAYLNESISRTDVAGRLEEEWRQGLSFRAGTKQYQPGGCVGEIIVRAKENMAEPLVALRYLWRRMAAPETLPALYDRLAVADLQPLGMDVMGQPCGSESK